MYTELLNCIADALNSYTVTGDFAAYTFCEKDKKFPIFTVHSVVIKDKTTGLYIQKQMKVHSVDVDQRTVKHKLITSALLDVLQKVGQGDIAAKGSDIIF